VGISFISSRLKMAISTFFVDLGWFCKILVSDDKSMNEVLDQTNLTTKFGK
jgi:hypothetical protein